MSRTERGARAGGREGTLSSRRALRLLVPLVLSLLAGASCFETEQGETFYGRVTTPPRAQEFRWSDGGLPRVFDPALAAAPPDTDAVRAIFEGLTDLDPVSLEPVAAVATRWEASPDRRQWTFHLRRDARWSNGDAVTAKDFVRSWRRTLQLGERAPHARLLENIEGARGLLAAQTLQPPAVTSSDTPSDLTTSTPAQPAASPQPTPAPAPTPAPTAATPAAEPSPSPTRAAPSTVKPATPTAKPAPSPSPEPFGVEAVGDHVLRVRLRRPDEHFPSLVAHPVFRPVHEAGADAASAPESKGEGGPGAKDEGETAGVRVVSNGAFRLSWSAADGVVLERASNYWDAGAVALERVRFVPARNAEEALAAYRRGEVDAVTNAAFTPLALKLLAPYRDFRRATYGALTYYSFNLARPPFNDRRVREALAIALDRERLSADAMNGATEPARTFLPEQISRSTPLMEKKRDESESSTGQAGDSQAAERTGEETNEERVRAGESPDDASANATPADTPPTRSGEPAADEKAEGASNESGAETSEASDAAAVPLEENVERARRLLAEAGFPDGKNFPRVRLLVNRNEQQRRMAQAVAAMWRERLGVETEIVMRGWDDYEAAFWSGNFDVARRSVVMQTTDEESNILAMFERAPRQGDAPAAPAETPLATPSPVSDPAAASAGTPAPAPPTPLLLTEAEALRELPAFPLYFASSYALVKPYVSGFDTNLLDAPSLKRVRVDTNWQPPAGENRIRVVSER